MKKAETPVCLPYWQVALAVRDGRNQERTLVRLRNSGQSQSHSQ